MEQLFIFDLNLALYVVSADNKEQACIKFYKFLVSIGQKDTYEESRCIAQCTKQNDSVYTLPGSLI